MSQAVKYWETDLEQVHRAKLPPVWQGRAWLNCPKCGRLLACPEGEWAVGDVFGCLHCGAELEVVG